MKMFLRWDMGLIHMDENIQILGNHAIFAKDYSMATGNYSCINSWGCEKVAELSIKDLCNGLHLYCSDLVDS